MAIRNLRIEGDPILRKTSKEVKEITPKIVELVDDMLETMYEANGVGLAAPQVTYMMHQLRKNGFDVTPDAITIEEAQEEVLKALEKRHQNAWRK